MTSLTRRQFGMNLAQGSGLMIVSAALPWNLTACGGTVESMAPAVSAVGDVLFFIPGLVGTTLAALFKAVASLLGGAAAVEKANEVEHTFQIGQTLEQPPPSWNGELEQIKPSDSSLRPFQARVEKPPVLVSPVVKHTGRYLQLGAKDGHFSIMAGTTGVHKIHNDWLEWMIQYDTCHLVPESGTDFGQCGKDDCPIWVSKQWFMKPNNERVRLNFVADEEYEKYSQTIKDSHTAHAPKWKGCPIAPLGKKEIHSCGL